jgi:LuxR family maltose regulon positive regulatory protein
MSTPLLATKLNIPELRPELVSRTRLLDALNEGLRRKLTLVAAPAGYGKTTLLSEWVHQIDASVAWLSLDVYDNDLNRFMAYFLAALQTASPEISPGSWPSLPSPQRPSIEVMLTPLLNELSSLDSPVVLVLDDFHVIDVDLIYRVLSFMLEHLPAQLHLLIATRSDPRLPVAQLRAKGELVELRESDLRFNDQEISQFLENVINLNLPGEQITKLASRTEGWIAGLQLAAISMKGHENLDKFIQEFSGSHEYIVDYLTDEVLKNQPDELHKFLLETSILDRMCGPLCEAVTGQSNGQGTLEALRDAHLFVIPLDDERHWYRYHRLFADHLHKRLRNLHPEKVKSLHRAAGDWFEGAGLLGEAIEHFNRAEDFQQSAHLLEQLAEEEMLRSEFMLFLRLSTALPQAEIDLHPQLGIARAMSLLMTGTPVDEVELMLDGLVCDKDKCLGGKYVVQATIAVIRGEFSTAYELAQRAIDLLTEEEYANLRDLAFWLISYTSSLGSKPSEGLLTLNKVITQSRVSGNEILMATASLEIAKLYTYQGELGKAKEVLEEILDFARDEEGHLLPIAGEVLITLGEIFRQENRLAEAEQTLKDGIDLAKMGRTATAYRGCISLARIKLAQGDVDSTSRYFQTANDLASFEFDRLFVAVAEVRFRISQGDNDAAEKWLEDRGQNIDLRKLRDSEDGIQMYIRKYEMLLKVRILLSRGQLREALTNLEVLQEQMEQQERLDIILEIQILKALVLQKQGELAESLITLETALSLAKPGGFIRIFVDEGEVMARLLRQVFMQEIHTDYVSQLLAAFSKNQPEPESLSQTMFHNDELVDPLSERELQVLRLLTSHLSSTEIAGELYISVNTVRFHIKNIYSKFGVHSRAEALDRAKDLGLLP